MKEGQLHGILFVSIDKLDGHVWEFEEKVRFKNHYVFEISEPTLQDEEFSRMMY